MTNSRSTKRTYCTDCCCCCCFSSNANHRTTKKRKKLEDQRWSWWWCLIKKSYSRRSAPVCRHHHRCWLVASPFFELFLPIFSSFLGISYRESNDVFAALYFRRQPLPPLDVRWIQLSASIAPFTARSLSLNKKKYGASSLLFSNFSYFLFFSFYHSKKLSPIRKDSISSTYLQIYQLNIFGCLAGWFGWKFIAQCHCKLNCALFLSLSFWARNVIVWLCSLGEKEGKGRRQCSVAT